MSDEHVLQHQHVSGLPGEGRGRLAKRFTDLVQYRGLNPGAIAVVGIAGQIFFFEDFEERLARRWSNTADVEEVSLVEPNHFSGFRVATNRLANVAQVQSIPIFPMTLHASFLAVLLDYVPICRLKGFLPGESKTVTEISHVHDILFDEALFDPGINEGEHPAIVCERSLTAV